MYCLTLISLKKLGRHGVRKSQRAYPASFDRALRALFVDYDANDLDLRWRIENFQHALRVGHLRNSRPRDEADCVDMHEPGVNEAAQICGLGSGRNIDRQALPCVARALNDFDCLVHSRLPSTAATLSPANLSMDAP